MTVWLPADAPIAVVAPCHPYDPTRLQAGLDRIAAAGHTAVLFDGALQPDRYLAAPDDVRRAHLLQAFDDPAFGAVWAARGGSGMSRLLRGLPVATWGAKTLIGFSDLTPLLNLHARHGGRALHAPVVNSLPQTDPDDVSALFAVLAGAEPTPLRGDRWQGGDVQGRLVGGNLSLLAATCGTPWQIDGRGAIVVIEEIGEVPYRVDRMFQQLRDAGLFDGAAGIALGGFDDCAPPRDATWSLEDVLRDLVAPLGLPTLANLPFGHGRRNLPLGLGRPATMAGDALSWR
jgi:muramoyltetrapeptide carboxypeptidase